MNQLVDKLRGIEDQVSKEKGDFLLFALFLREDAPDLWDLLVAAPWISKDKSKALHYLSSKLNGALTPEDVLKLSRIVIIESSNPALSALQQAINVEHGTAEIRDSNFFGLQIKHAFLITSRRLPEEAPNNGLHADAHKAARP